MESTGKGKKVSAFHATILNTLPQLPEFPKTAYNSCQWTRSPFTRHKMGLTNNLVFASWNVGGYSNRLPSVHYIKVFSQRLVEQEDLLRDTPQDDAALGVRDLYRGVGNIPGNRLALVKPTTRIAKCSPYNCLNGPPLPHSTLGGLDNRRNEDITLLEIFYRSCLCHRREECKECKNESHNGKPHDELYVTVRAVRSVRNKGKEYRKLRLI